jgi:hypothetical protein
MAKFHSPVISALFTALCWAHLQPVCALPATEAAPADSAIVPIQHIHRAKLISASPAPSFKIGSKFSRSLQTVTGINFITQICATQATRMAVHKKLGGKVKVRLKTYSLTDLIAGKVKSISIEVNDPKLKGIGLGEVSLASQNPIWFKYRGGKNRDGQPRERGLQAPTMMLVRAELSQKQIAEALTTPKLTSSLSGLKLDLPGLGEQQLQVLDPHVEIGDDLIKLEAVLVTEGGNIDTGVPLKITARPRLVGDSKIVLEDLQVEGPDIIEPEKFAHFAQDLLNPLVDFARMDRSDHAFRLAALTVSHGGVAGDGKLLLVPKPKKKIDGSAKLAQNSEQNQKQSAATQSVSAPAGTTAGGTAGSGDTSIHTGSVAPQ